MVIVFGDGNGMTTEVDEKVSAILVNIPDREISNALPKILEIFVASTGWLGKIGNWN